MKRSLTTILVTSLIVSLLSGCAVLLAAVPDNQAKARSSQLNAAEKSYPNEVLATPDFKVSKGEWFKVNLFEDWLARQKSNAPFALQDQHEANCRSLKPMQVQMSAEIRKKKASFYALYFYVNHGIDINFEKGALILTFKDTLGNTVEVPDNGCLFVYHEGVKTSLYDSARGSVRFNRDFNNSPDYKKGGNLVCVRMHPKYENWDLIALKLEPQKISTLQ